MGWQFTIRAYGPGPQDEPGRAGATEEQKFQGVQLGVCTNVIQIFSQGLHSPLSVGYLLSIFFNLLRFYFFTFL